MMSERPASDIWRRPFSGKSTIGRRSILAWICQLLLKRLQVLAVLILLERVRRILRRPAATLARPAIAGRHQGVLVTLDDLQNRIEAFPGVVVAQFILLVESLELLAEPGPLLVAEVDRERFLGELIQLEHQ